MTFLNLQLIGQCINTVPSLMNQYHIVLSSCFKKTTIIHLFRLKPFKDDFYHLGMSSTQLVISFFLFSGLATRMSQEVSKWLVNGL